MTGVDILATEEVSAGFVYNYNWIWIMAVIACVIGLILSIHGVVHDGEDWKVIPTITSLMIIAGLVVGTIISIFTGKPTKYETHYKVTISDEVKMTEFLEKYEIVDTDGRIYTIKEKSDGEE